MPFEAKEDPSDGRTTQVVDTIHTEWMKGGPAKEIITHTPHRSEW